MTTTPIAKSPPARHRTRPQPKTLERKRAIDLTVPDKPAVLTQAEGTVMVNRTLLGVPSDTQEKVAVPVFSGTPAYIEIEGSVTRNMGNFNSSRVGVMIRWPCLPEASEVERTKQYVSGLVEKYILEEMELAGMPVEVS